MLSCLIETEIQLCHIGVVRQGIRRIEAETGKVQAAVVAACRIVADRILIQHAQDRLACSDMQRIDRLKIGLRECRDSSVRVCKLQNPLAHVERWNMLELAYGTSIRTPF